MPMKAFLTAVAFCLCAGHASAQCGTTSIGSVTRSPVSVTLSTPTLAMFDANVAVFTQTITFSINASNNGTRYNVCLLATTATLGTATGGGYTKPIGDLQYSLDNSTWTNLSSSQQQIANQVKGDQSYTVYLRVTLDYDDSPGNYATSLRLVASS
jgi:hypothetical protein